jgi:23S rRNA (adenine2503-C2)-methyltransferase
MEYIRKNIADFTEGELRSIFQGNKIEGYRSEQVYRFLHRKLKKDFSEMTNLPEKLRQFLADNFYIRYPEIPEIETSAITETKKYLFKDKDDGKKYESVFMREKSRVTYCISSQSGCNAGCKFCGTGYMGFTGNLSAGDIVMQVYSIIQNTGLSPTNIVYMGMGEPFLNYNNVMNSLKILTSENGLGISSRKITVSTIGLKGKIKEFADELTTDENKKIKNVKLALSLHSTDEKVREMLIPLSRKNKLKDILDEIVYFYRKTKNKITYEYIWFEGINDTAEDIKRIKKLSRMLPCNFNIIPFHPIENIAAGTVKPESKAEEELIKKLKEPNNSLSNKNLNHFIDRLRKESVVANIRSSNGSDISAACGQLALKK